VVDNEDEDTDDDGDDDDGVGHDVDGGIHDDVYENIVLMLGRMMMNVPTLIMM
jgi:hypothetical protein